MVLCYTFRSERLPFITKCAFLSRLSSRPSPHHEFEDKIVTTLPLTYTNPDPMPFGKSTSQHFNSHDDLKNLSNLLALTTPSVTNAEIMQATISPVPVRFLCISDTHGVKLDENKQHPFSLPLPKADVLLHSGDLTQCGSIRPFKDALEMMSQIDAELKLVIAGNHDLELDPQYGVEEGEEQECAEAIALMTGPLAKEAGVTYLNEGTYSFTLSSGATFTIYVSPYSVEYGDYVYGTKLTEDRYSSKTADDPIPDNVDIIMTHGPPKTIRDTCLHDGKEVNVGCPALLEATARVKPKLHCFGHIHEGYGATTVTWDGNSQDKEISKPTQLLKCNYIDAKQENYHTQSLYVNAAIQAEGGAFSNPPFIVDLMLPARLAVS